MTDISFRKFSNISAEDSELRMSTRPPNYMSSGTEIGSDSFDNAKLCLQADGCERTAKQAHVRNLIGFWLLGLCNNYAYVIMLSAAVDILSKEFNDSGQSGTGDHNDIVNGTICNPTSTGAILLADILPSLAIKMTAPFFIPGKHFRVAIVVLLSASSFLLTSLSVAQWMSFLGVICAALSSGLGEVTFLSISSHFNKNVVSTWSSGTGGAGLVGSLAYASLTTAGVNPRTTLQIFLFIPVLLALSFWVLIVHPPSTKLKLRGRSHSSSQECIVRHEREIPPVDPVKGFSFREKLSLVKPLLKYMIPLSLVYFAEYFINQGVQETIYFKDIWLDHKEQYRWYQVDYQLGVLISRSSVNFIKIRRLWVLPILQVINAVFLFCVAYFRFLPHYGIWIVLAIILYEGLLGGAAYVSTFYRISEEIPVPYREFSMGIASLGDSCGIAVAGAIALPVHDVLCRRPLP